jgi:hypothetical protein
MTPGHSGPVIPIFKSFTFFHMVETARWTRVPFTFVVCLGCVRDA